MLNFEKIGPEFTHLLAELCTETFTQAYEGVHSKQNLEIYCREYYSEKAIEESLSLDNTVAVVAFQEKEPSGFYVLKHHSCPIKLDGQASELKQIYVMSSYYGGGLGRKLFDSSVEQSKIDGSKWLWLCVSDINYQAQTFYKKLGFTQIGEGPTLLVGSDKLTSSILSLEL